MQTKIGQKVDNKPNYNPQEISIESSNRRRMKIPNERKIITELSMRTLNTVVRIPEGTIGPKVSLFYGFKNKVPQETMDLWEFLLSADYGYDVCRYRDSSDKEERLAIKSSELPCVTVAGIFDTRAKTRLQHIHSGCICIDIDGKQNPNMRGKWGTAKRLLKEQFSSLCYAGLSIGGNGLCLVFRIAYPERHKAHFYALVDEIRERTRLIVDENGSDIVRLRVASYDHRPYFNPDAPPYLHYKLNKYGAPRKIRASRTAKVEEATKQRVYTLIKAIGEQKKDITRGYEIWRTIGQALAEILGADEGLRLFHKVSLWHPEYDPTECDGLFAWCISNHDEVDISTFFYHCKRYGLRFK